MVEVIINGVSIDLISKTVKYTKQVNDLADLSTVNTSFTYSIQVDKTPKNTTLFKNLGMIGDTSDFPYVQNLTQLIDNGKMLISHGISIVKETDENYKLHIQDGIVEVFKLLENKTIGTDLDLAELNHTKDPPAIIESWNNETPYKYLVADYNGRTNIDFGDLDGKYLMPSASVKYLWDLIFNYIGYTYSGFLPSDKKWVSYPKESASTEPVLIFQAPSTFYDGEWPTTQYKEWLDSPVTPEGITILDDWQIRIDVPGIYFFDINTIGYMLWWTSLSVFIDLKFKIAVKINGETLTYIFSEPVNTEVPLNSLQEGDIVELEIVPLSQSDIPEANYELIEPTKLYIDVIFTRLYRSGQGDYDFSQAFNSFKIKDFFKEIMFREALTPFVDNNTKHIEFLNLSERLDVSTAVDLSDKYIRRTNEQYVFESYAQKNILRLKYNNEDDNYNDGAFYVENKNIEDEKILFESKFYSPERDPVFLRVHPSAENELFPLVKIWNKEIKEEENEEGEMVQVIEYKSLSNRFYYLSEELKESPIKINGTEANFYYKANLSGTLFQQVILSKYSDINKIFTDTRIHQIELALSAYDFVVLDLKKPVYFDQEKQFYIVNKIIWESGKPAKGEFLRVKNI